MSIDLENDVLLRALVEAVKLALDRVDLTPTEQIVILARTLEDLSYREMADEAALVYIHGD